jgi:DNA-directed RNA polymerase subunit RPC12/RpoP
MILMMNPESSIVSLHCGVCGEGFEPAADVRGMLEEALASDPTAKPYLRCPRCENSSRY